MMGHFNELVSNDEKYGEDRGKSSLWEILEQH